MAAGSRSAPSATTRMSASNVPASVTTRLAAGSIDRTVVCRNRTPGLSTSRYGWRASAGICRPNITSSLEKPKTNASPLSMRTMSMASPKASERIVVSSRPPKPAPSTTTRVCMAWRISVQSGPWHASSAPSPARTRPPSASRSTATSRTTRRGRRSSSTTSRCSTGSPKRSPTCCCSIFNDHVTSFFFDHYSRVRARHRRAVSGGRRRRRRARAAAGRTATPRSRGTSARR